MTAQPQSMAWPTLPGDVTGFAREVWVRAMCQASPGQQVSDTAIAGEMRVDKARVRRVRVALTARNLWLWALPTQAESGRMGRERQLAKIEKAKRAAVDAAGPNTWLPTPEEIAREALRIRMQNLEAMSHSGLGGGNGHADGVAVHRPGSFGSKRWNGRAY